VTLRHAALLSIKIIGAIFLFLIIAGLVITLAFGNRIKEIVVAEVNRQLATEVKVNGEIQFSVFSAFPYASVSFQDVMITESLPEKNNLLACKKISLLFNIWDVLRKDYRLVKVIATDGTMNIRLNEEGHPNYNIFKKSDSTSKNFSLKIEEAILTSLQITYDDARSDQHYIFETDKSELTGQFASTEFELGINSGFFCKQLLINEIDYLRERNVELDCKLKVNLQKNEFTFSDGAVLIEGNHFNVNGTVTTMESGNDLHLQIEGKELRMEEIAALLPDEYAAYLSRFQSKGFITFNGSIQGIASSKQNPAITCDFGISHGSIRHNKMKHSFEKVNLGGTYSNGTSRNLATSSVALKNLQLVFEGNPVNGTLVVQNFKSPFIDATLNGTVLLQNITPMLESSFVKEMDGSVAFQNFYFRGSSQQLSTSLDLNKIEAGGSFEMKDVMLITTQTKYHHINGKFTVANNRTDIQQCSLHAQNSDLSFNGTVDNLIPYLMTSLQKTKSNNQKIAMNITVASDYLKWEELLGASTTPVNPEDYYSIPPLFYILKGSVNGNIGKLAYQNFNATDLHGNILFLGETIFFDNIGLHAEKGTITGNGKLDIADPHHNYLELAAKLHRLDVTQLFLELNDFDQTTLTHEHLKGTFTSDLVLKVTWDDRKLNKSKLYAIADVAAENGELNNFEPMMALGTFVKINELKNIRFSKMQNQIEIKDQKVFIPSMQIFTNALNVQLTGFHGFDNMIDYKVQLNLLELLTAKIKKNPLADQSTEETTLGLLNLYLTMTGPAADPEIRYDKKSVKEKINSDLKEEKKELMDILKNEFNKKEEQKQEIMDWKAPDEPEYMEFEEDSIAMDHDAEQEAFASNTKQHEQKEFENLKNIFKPKQKR